METIIKATASFGVITLFLLCAGETLRTHRWNRGMFTALGLIALQYLILVCEPGDIAFTGVAFLAVVNIVALCCFVINLVK